MPKTLERPIFTSPDNDKGSRHILADDGIREAYHEVRKIRLEGAASAAGVIKPGSARLARERALEEARALAEPGKYHIPHPHESED